MKKIFSKFLLSYISLSAALLVILLVVSVYIYSFSRNTSYNEGHSHLSAQMEIFENNLDRILALISITSNQNSVVKTAPSRKDQRRRDQSRRDLVNAVTAISSDMIVDYGIVFQNGLCITANRIFISPSNFYTPEQKIFNGAIYSLNMRLRNVSYKSNRAFFVINTDILLDA
jgi:hypothetical protein